MIFKTDVLLGDLHSAKDLSSSGGGLLVKLLRFLPACGSRVGIVAFPKLKCLLVDQVQNIPVHTGKMSISTVCDTECEVLTQSVSRRTAVN